MDVQPIHNKNPASVWRCRYRLLDVRGKVLFRPRRPNRRRQELPGGHLKIADEGLGPMPDVFVFWSFHQAGQHGTRGMRPLQRLYAGLLICTHDMDPLGLQGLRLVIQRAHGPHVGIELLGSLGAVMVEPIPALMRL
jgi:hypothetical protein